MKKICHLTTVHNRYDSRIFQKQCISLYNNGYEVVLLCADGLSCEEVKGIHIESIVHIQKNVLFRILISPISILSLAKKHNSDLYFIHDPELIPVGLQLKKARKKVIYDSHEDFPRQILEKEWIPKILRKFLSFSAEIYLKNTLKKFDAVLSVTPHIVDILKTYTHNVHLITNYPVIDDDSLKFTKEDYLTRDNRLCYSGTVYKNSLQKNIILSLKNIPNFQYWIVGSLDPRLKESLSKIQGWEKVHYIPKVQKNELIKIYATVTIGIVLFEYSPNLGNKQGTLGNNKLFEYMHYGLPLICTDFILWKKIIEKYKCGIYVDPYNVEQIELAIKYLIENKSEAYQMGQNGKWAILEEFNWKTQEKVYLDLVNKIINLF